MIVDTDSLRTGKTLSCGCLGRSRYHGRVHSGEYGSWRSMLARCYRVNHPNYVNYGARGVVVDERWRHSFWAFFVDMGERPPGCTLDRVNVDGPYTLSNCRWSSWAEQRRNQRRMAA